MATESIQVHSLAELLEIPEGTKSLWVKPLDSLEMWAAIQRFSQLEELVVPYAKEIPDLSGLHALPHLHTFRLLSNDRLERSFFLPLLLARLHLCKNVVS